MPLSFSLPPFLPPTWWAEHWSPLLSLLYSLSFSYKLPGILFFFITNPPVSFLSSPSHICPSLLQMSQVLQLQLITNFLSLSVLQALPAPPRKPPQAASRHLPLTLLFCPANGAQACPLNTSLHGQLLLSSVSLPHQCSSPAVSQEVAACAGFSDRSTPCPLPCLTQLIQMRSASPCLVRSLSLLQYMLDDIP